MTAPARGVRRRGLRGALVAAVAVVLVLAVALAVTAFLPAEGGDVPVATAALGRFLRRVPAEGNLRASRSVSIVAPTNPAQLRIVWLAPEGQRMRAGDVVARFDRTETEKTLLDARDDLAMTRLKGEKQQAEDGAAAARLAGEERIAEKELEGALRFKKKDDLIFSRSEIIESAVDEQLARERERHARDARRIRGRVGEADSALLAIEEEKARFRMGQAEQALSALSVVSPADGVLVYHRDWRGMTLRLGDTVWDGQKIAELPDLAEMQAEVFVLEADAGGLAVGKPASVELESAPGTWHPARIARVDSLAKPRLRGSPVQYFALTLALERTEPGRMKPGTRVRAWLTLDDLPRAVSVPRQAVFEREGRNVVYRRRGGGGFEAVPVTLGPSGLGRVVIASGLAAGDTVALRDPTRAAALPAGGEGAGTEPGAGAPPAAPAAAPGTAP